MPLTISGCYEEDFSTSSNKKVKKTQLEIRIDVDGKLPMNVVSGDIYSTSGKTRDYLSSFIFERVKKVRRENEAVLTCESGRHYLESELLTRFQIRISINSSPLTAKVSWIDSSGTESRCCCRYKSKYFRRVLLQNDYEEGIVPFKSYDASVLSSPCPNHARQMKLSDAYAEAGIEIVSAKKARKPVPHPKQIPERGSIWTDSALHKAMTEHFELLKEHPQWEVWLFSAFQYEVPDVKGIMLDYEGKKRKGCAVFHRAIGEETNEEQRMLLFVYVHELGHCLNLQHPGEESRTNCHTGNDCLSSLSWMNNPQRYYLSVNSYGEAAFWKNFQFRFSDSELIHLRHAFRNDVIFGGNVSRKYKTDL